MNLEISLEDLLKNGSHFGHNKKRWNPKMEKYIYGEKNGTHILDLRKSLPLIENALKFSLESAKNKKKFLFVSTKKQHGEIVENIAKETDNYYVNFSEKQNYRFNSNISGIEDSDLILMIGCNPRLEATILNSRIRKSYLRSKLQIYSTNDVGDQTYPYKILDNSTNLLKDIIEGRNELSEKNNL